MSFAWFFILVFAIFFSSLSFTPIKEKKYSLLIPFSFISIVLTLMVFFITMTVYTDENLQIKNKYAVCFDYMGKGGLQIRWSDKKTYVEIGDKVYFVSRYKIKDSKKFLPKYDSIKDINRASLTQLELHVIKVHYEKILGVFDNPQNGDIKFIYDWQDFYENGKCITEVTLKE